MLNIIYLYQFIVNLLQLFYQNYEKVDPIAIKLPACDYFCPFDQFYSLVEEILPESDSDCST